MCWVEPLERWHGCSLHLGSDTVSILLACLPHTFLLLLTTHGHEKLWSAL